MGDDKVTPPRGSGSIQLAAIARDLSAMARFSAHLRAKNSLRLAEAEKLRGHADRLEQMAHGFESWKKMVETEPEVVHEARKSMVNELAEIKGQLEELGVSYKSHGSRISDAPPDTERDP